MTIINIYIYIYIVKLNLQENEIERERERESTWVWVVRQWFRSMSWFLAVAEQSGFAHLSGYLRASALADSKYSNFRFIRCDSSVIYIIFCFYKSRYISSSLFDEHKYILLILLQLDYKIFCLKLRVRLVHVFKNWKLLFENFCENTCGWKSMWKCVKCCLKTKNCCLKT